MMTSRERVERALAHQEPDKVPLDLGASAVTGMQVNAVYLLRQALGLDAPGTPVKVVEPYQMLGEIAPDLMEALGVDVVGLGMPRNLFGYKNEGWKPWTTFDGTPVLVPERFNTEPNEKGEIMMYPQGDKSVMLEGSGFEIMDLGVDVAPEKFVEAIHNGAQVVAMSALLTTTMTNMKGTIEAIKAAGVRDKTAIIVGGAPVTQNYAQEIGADAYAPDASSAVRKVRELVGAPG
jgi:hypothetical protein